MGGTVTVKEASCSDPDPPTTRHTYSPESDWETWWSRSREPWVCRNEEVWLSCQSTRGRASPQAQPCQRVRSSPLGLRSSELQLRGAGGWFIDAYKSHISPFVEGETGSGDDSAAEPGEEPRSLDSPAGDNSLRKSI